MLQTRRMLLLALALIVPACSNGSSIPGPVVPVVPAGLFLLTASNRLLSIDPLAPAVVVSSVAIGGLQAGEDLLGIDVRPATGQLYAVSDLGRLLTIDSLTGAATLVATLAADPTDLTSPFTTLNGTNFGLDFNPVPDRLRLVSDAGQNLRIHPTSGFVTTDLDLNSGSTTASGAAYTGSHKGVTSTSLYVIDAASDALYLQNPPNNGTLTVVGALGVDATGVNGFDIHPRTSLGYAALTVGGVFGLYTVNLTTGVTLPFATSPNGEELRGLAFAAVADPVAHAITIANQIVTFDPYAPGTIASFAALSGLGLGEIVVGIDIRPANGLLYGLTNLGRVGVIDPATGVVSPIVTLTADPVDLTSPFVALSGVDFGVDFNPVPDRLRIVGDSGQDLRVNVDTGLVTSDADLNPGTPAVTAVAYANNFAGTTSTTLYDLGAAADTLYIQNPPNNGTLLAVGAGLGADVAGDAGFDIFGGGNVGLAAIRPAGAGPFLVYRIELGAGTATAVTGNPATSAIGGAGGPLLRGFCVRF
jgi:hypothetical protein